MVVGGLAPPPEEEEQRREVEAGQGIIFILEGANLEVAQVGKVRYEQARARNVGAPPPPLPPPSTPLRCVALLRRPSRSVLVPLSPSKLPTKHTHTYIHTHTH